MGSGGAVTQVGRAGSPAQGSWGAEAMNVVRAVSGGLLFGVPLLYTMEVWWAGSHTSPPQMLLVLAILAVPLVALNMTSGFRSDPDVRPSDALAHTAEALAVGLVVSFIVLVLLREITGATPVGKALGEVVYESVPFCLGVGVARHFLSGRRSGPDDDGDGSSDTASSAHRTSSTVADLGGTMLGAVFIALSIAPTDEVPMIASAMGPGWLLALLGASLVASYVIVFAAGFGRQDERHAQEGAFQHPVTETVVSYLVALVVAAALLWLFQRGEQPEAGLVDRVLVLGFPAAIGGAAGRLAV
jgi:putative integral membrane protein (TIGR02587 family)